MWLIRFTPGICLVVIDTDHCENELGPLRRSGKLCQPVSRSNDRSHRVVVDRVCHASGWQKFKVNKDVL